MFTNADSQAKNVVVMYKSGDDLRQVEFYQGLIPQASSGALNLILTPRPPHTHYLIHRSMLDDV